MDLARAYWTFKLEVEDFVGEHPNTGFGAVLGKVELDTASVFFPPPGPAGAAVSLLERRERQRELLSVLAPEMDVDRFLAENPILRRQHGSGSGLRIVPLTYGLVRWLIAAGLCYWLPNIVTAIIGCFLLWSGWSSIKMALFGSQQLKDAMTRPEDIEDSEVVTEWRKFYKLD